MEIRDSLYIAGTWRLPVDGRAAAAVMDSHSEQVMARVPMAGPGDVDHAVAAAAEAQPSWAALPAAARADYLATVADALSARAAALTTTIAREVGTPVGVGRTVQVESPIVLLRTAERILRSFRFEVDVATSIVIREPVGVVACITPWNFPLGQVIAKVASAMAVGCTVVVKSAAEAPLSVFALADAVHEAGLPPGVFNLVNGAGPVVGEALVVHPAVDMVSFTGSTEVGTHIGARAARTVKRLALELGGKSPNIMLPDVDVESAVADGLGRAFLNSGQTCSALTRMLVPRQRLEEFEQAAVAAVADWTMGDPLAENTRLGPLVSDRQRASVRAYINSGIREGALLLAGGAEAPSDLPTGYYVRPTIFSRVRNEMTVAREEIFGPVLAILAYHDEDDAVRIANDTVYGLAGGVWSADREHAESVARRLRAGQVSVNGGAFNPLAPFGGMKQSGYGRERGRFGFDEFIELKSLQF